MAGNERSGRRPLAATTGEIPPLGKTAKTIGDYLDSVAWAVTHNEMDARIGDTAIAAAKAQTALLKLKAQKSEMSELEKLVKRAEAAVEKGLAHEVAARQHADEDPH